MCINRGLLWELSLLITDVHAQDIAGAHAHAQDIVGTWPWILCMMFTTSAITLR